MKRSKFENDKELVYNVRVNGRIVAAFRPYQMAEDCAYALARERSAVVEISDQYGDTRLTLRPAN